MKQQMVIPQELYNLKSTRINITPSFDWEGWVQSSKGPLLLPSDPEFFKKIIQNDNISLFLNLQKKKDKRKETTITSSPINFSTKEFFGENLIKSDIEIKSENNYNPKLNVVLDQDFLEGDEAELENNLIVNTGIGNMYCFKGNCFKNITLINKDKAYINEYDSNVYYRAAKITFIDKKIKTLKLLNDEAINKKMQQGYKPVILKCPNLESLTIQGNDIEFNTDIKNYSLKKCKKIDLSNVNSFNFAYRSLFNRYPAFTKEEITNSFNLDCDVYVNPNATVIMPYSYAWCDKWRDKLDWLFKKKDDERDIYHNQRTTIKELYNLKTDKVVKLKLRDLFPISLGKTQEKTKKVVLSR